MRAMPDAQRRVLESLAAHPEHNVLVNDGADRRWYLYEFDETPPVITDIRQDVAEVLVDQGLVEYMDQDTEQRKDLPDDYAVYSLSDKGRREARHEA